MKEREDQEQKKGNKNFASVVSSQNVNINQQFNEYIISPDDEFKQQLLENISKCILSTIQHPGFPFEHGRVLKITQQEINHPDYPHYAYEVTRDVHGNILEKKMIPLSEQAKNPKFRVRINPREVEDQMIETLEAALPPENVIEQEGLPSGGKIAWVLKSKKTFVLGLMVNDKKVFPYLEMDMYVLPFSNRILLDNRNQESDLHIRIILETKGLQKVKMLVTTKEACRGKVTSVKRALESVVTIDESGEINLWDLKLDEPFLRFKWDKKPKEDIEQTKRYIKYLEKLEKIEKHFGITFKLSNQLKKDDIKTVEFLYMIATNKKPLTFTAVFSAKEITKLKADGPTKLKVTLPPNTIELYGVRIPLPKIKIVCYRSEISKTEMVYDGSIRVLFKLDPNYTKVQLNNGADY